MNVNSTVVNNAKQTCIFLIDHITKLDSIIKKVSRVNKDKQKEEIFNVAWFIISMNSSWIINTYKDMLVSNKSALFYEYAFACRLLLETSCDLKYYYYDASNEEVDKIFKEKELIEKSSRPPKKLFSKEYCKDFSPDKKTLDRIYKYAEAVGLAHYHTLCWDTHFNYVGYFIARNCRVGDGVYEYLLTYVIHAVGIIYDVLISEELIVQKDLEEYRAIGNKLSKKLRSDRI